MSTIVLRSVKGSPLTNAEVDANFTNLNNDKTELGGTYSSGTANGVLFLSSSKVLTTGSALTFDGTNLGAPAEVYRTSATSYLRLSGGDGAGSGANVLAFGQSHASAPGRLVLSAVGTGDLINATISGAPVWQINSAEQMRLTSKALMVGYTSDAGFSGQYNAAISGSLGIGTSSPGAQLQINRSGTGDYTTFRLSNSGASGKTYEIGVGGNTSASGYANNLYFYDSTAGALRMTLDSSGNLGLGVTPSATSASGVLFFKSNGQFSFSGPVAYQDVNVTYNSGADRYIANGHATRFASVNGVMSWQNAPSGTAGNAISFSQVMTLDASGNLRLGTTGSSDARLYVRGSGTTSATASFEAANSSGATRLFVQDDGTTRFFGSAGSETARITSGGDLLVGTTTAVGSGTNTTASTTLALSYNWFAVTDSMYVQRSNNTDGTVFQFFRGSSNAGNISITTSTTAYNTSSDYRLKNTIAPMTGALAKVALLKPCTYKWNADGSDGEGFIAHELAEVVPQCVTGEKDAVDAEGKPQYQGIDTSFLVATVVAALQELKAEFDAYKASHP